MLPQMLEASDNREIIFNGLFAAVEPAALYGFDYENTTGLDLAYFGGQFNGNTIAADSITLTDNATNYVVADLSTGVVSDSTSNTNFNDTTNYLQLYIATTVAGAITALVDYRQTYAGSGGGGGASVSDTAYAGSWDGVTTIAPSKNAVYDQMELRAPKASPTFSGTITTPLTASRAVVTGASNELAAATTTATEIGYVNGVTSAIQTQLGTKLPRAPSVQSVSSSATVTPTFADDLVIITAQAAGLTLANPTGTSAEGAGMVIRIKDNGTARSIAYDTQYRAIGLSLPATTVISKTLYLAMIFNNTDTKWDVVAAAQEV